MFKKHFTKSSIIAGLVLTTGFVNAFELTQSKSNSNIIINGIEKNNKLIVTTPNGVVKTFSINSDHYILSATKLGQSQLQDGQYKFEIVPHFQADSLATQIRKSNNKSLAQDYADTFKNKDTNQSGVFTIADSYLIVSEPEDSTILKSVGETIKDQVILDDLIVNGSGCLGQDCVNGESFGFDTLRLKENNLRIKFQDTSTSASFPSNDWQLTANDSANGGADKFSIDDIDGGRTPFTLEAGAPSHSLYVDSAGRVGLGTSNPVVELHVVNGDSPTLRLEQNGSSGFGAQTWDVAGNETNFFVRDATNGSKLPFKIRPNAPTNSLYIDADGDIGLGNSAPDARLHVTGGLHVTGAAQFDSGFSSLAISGSDGTTNLSIEETNAVEQNRVLLNLTNLGGSEIQFNTSNPFGVSWSVRSDSSNGSFKISKKGQVTAPFEISSGGDIIQSGVTLHSSDRNKKKNINEVDPQLILEKVSELPIATWQYKSQADEIVHMGPMAQDFRAAFGLGINDITISDTDVAGVALASIKALKSELDQRDIDMQQLQETNNQLEQRLYNLEARFFAKEKSVVQQ
jgi:hypothetical protein